MVNLNFKTVVYFINFSCIVISHIIMFIIFIPDKSLLTDLEEIAIVK